MNRNANDVADGIMLFFGRVFLGLVVIAAITVLGMVAVLLFGPIGFLTPLLPLAIWLIVRSLRHVEVPDRM